MKNVDLKFPYAAIFCRKNDSIESALIESDDEIYKTGTFIHIQEVVPIKDSLRLLVQDSFSKRFFRRNSGQNYTDFVLKKKSCVNDSFDLIFLVNIISGLLAQNLMDLRKLSLIFRSKMSEYLARKHVRIFGTLLYC